MLLPTFADLDKRWRRVTPPAAEPLHRHEVKAQASLTADITQFDADFDRWIAAARDLFEQQAEVALLTQTWELVLDQFPRDGIELWMPPVRAIESFEYVDYAGATQSLTTDDYLADLESFPAVLTPLWGTIWPPSRCQPRGVVIRFRTGYATPAVADAASDTLAVSPNDFTADQSVRISQSGGGLPAGLLARTEYFVRNPSGGSIQLAATSGGAAIDLSSAGSGQLLVGEVPDQACQAIRLLVAHWWRNRESVSEAAATAVPLGWDALVAGCHWR